MHLLSYQAVASCCRKGALMGNGAIGRGVDVVVKVSSVLASPCREGVSTRLDLRRLCREPFRAIIQVMLSSAGGKVRFLTFVLACFLCISTFLLAGCGQSPRVSGSDLILLKLRRLKTVVTTVGAHTDTFCQDQCKDADDYELCLLTCALDSRVSMFMATHEADPADAILSEKRIEDTTEDLSVLVDRWLETATDIHLAADPGNRSGALDMISVVCYAEFGDRAGELEYSNRGEFFALAVIERLAGLAQENADPELQDRIVDDILKLAEQGSLDRALSTVTRVSLLSVVACLATTPSQLDRLESVVAARPGLEQEVDYVSFAIEALGSGGQGS